MYQHILGMRRPVRAVPSIRLGIVVILALAALAVPAPARAASDASTSAAADLCATVASRAGFSGERLVTAVAVGLPRTLIAVASGRTLRTTSRPRRHR